MNKNSKLTRADLAWFILAAMFCLPSHAETNDHQAAILEAALELNRSITWGMATNGVKAGIYHSKISDEPQTKGGFWDNAVFHKFQILLQVILWWFGHPDNSRGIYQENGGLRAARIKIRLRMVGSRFLPLMPMEQ